MFNNNLHLYPKIMQKKEEMYSEFCHTSALQHKIHNVRVQCAVVSN